MPTYRIELRRTVQRVVELDQTASLFIEADNETQARHAAYALSDTIDEHATWYDDDASRVATNDKEVRSPRFERAQLVRGPARLKASEILGAD